MDNSVPIRGEIFQGRRRNGNIEIGILLSQTMA
jgi:hypothetical protein